MELPTRIVRYPDPVLRQKTLPIETFDESLAALAQRMFELMRAVQGLGLAGPQVGIARQIFVCNPTGQPQDDRVYINPQLSDLTGIDEVEEGCLSLPEIRVTVHRAKRCKIQARDLQGQPIDEIGEELVARVWQHEIDHLEGRLIIDRMNTTDRIANKKNLAQLEAATTSRVI